MVPMADMLNHYRPRETRWGFDEDSKMFTIHSCCEIGVGDSVYDSYGKKCQHRFLLNYGFSIENNREPDGRNPNQLHMIFDLLPDDDALNIKHMLLEQCLNVSRDQTRRGIRVSTVYTEKTTTEAFSYLRFIHMTDHELMPLFPRCQVSGLNQTHVFGWLRGKCSKVVVPHPFFFLSSSFSCFSFFFSVWSMGHYT
jgi:histone-lysine N-methyltransferase SETD3